MESLGSILKAAVVAGLIAGAVVAGFHTLLIEPVIERAIELEEHQSQAQGKTADEPVIDRPTQRWGMVLGFLLYGGIWGLLFGGVSYAMRGREGWGWSTARRGFLLALLAGWSVAMFPFLKYPANPPGVGDPDTIGYRQAFYFGFIALSVIGTILAIGLQRALHQASWSSAMGRLHWPITVAFYVIYATIVYVAMPTNTDPIEMPAQLVWTFRAISFGGLILFWVILGGAFGWLLHEASPRRVERPEN